MNKIKTENDPDIAIQKSKALRRSLDPLPCRDLCRVWLWRPRARARLLTTGCRCWPRSSPISCATDPGRRYKAGIVRTDDWVEQDLKIIITWLSTATKLTPAYLGHIVQNLDRLTNLPVGEMGNMAMMRALLMLATMLFVSEGAAGSRAVLLAVLLHPPAISHWPGINTSPTVDLKLKQIIKQYFHILLSLNLRTD